MASTLVTGLDADMVTMDDLSEARVETGVPTKADAQAAHGRASRHQRTRMKKQKQKLQQIFYKKKNERVWTPLDWWLYGIKTTLFDNDVRIKSNTREQTREGKEERRKTKETKWTRDKEVFVNDAKCDNVFFDWATLLDVTHIQETNNPHYRPLLWKYYY